jgi:hypothetical protein
MFKIERGPQRQLESLPRPDLVKEAAEVIDEPGIRPRSVWRHHDAAVALVGSIVAGDMGSIGNDLQNLIQAISPTKKS